MKFSLVLGGLSLVAARHSKYTKPYFDERERIMYTFKSIPAFDEQERSVVKIIQKDTGAEYWPCTLSLPPMCMPPPVSLGAVEQLKELPGVVVRQTENVEL